MGTGMGTRCLETFFCHLLTAFTVRENPLNTRRNIVTDLEKYYRYV